MFICRDCGSKFEDPKRVKESRGEFWGAPAYEDCWYCPECGSDDYDEAKECGVCGQWFLPDGCEETCEECIDNLSNELYKIQIKYGIDYETLQTWIIDKFDW